MKTFEERYTAWIDGQLTGSSLAAFEQELSRRAAAGEAEADRHDTLRLRHLLREHLDAPELNNGEFFSHQIRERINAERGARGGTAERGAGRRRGVSALFPWSIARLAGLGAACLFVAGALYYGLEPGPAGKGARTVAASSARVDPRTGSPGSAMVESQPVPSAVPGDRADSNQLVLRSPTPTPFPDAPSDDIQVRDTPGASATSLHYRQPDVNVLWTNNLEYLPDLSTPTVPAPSPAPSVSVTH
jgi:hypothetical protein